jgi:hypothetical protein
MRHLEIGGITFRPCSTNLAENESTWMSTDYSTDNDFLKKYNNYIAAMQIVAGCAKIYVEKNWTKVKDWSDLHLIVKDNTGKTTEYYKYKKDDRKGWRKSETIQKMHDRIDKSNEAKHNPIQTLTDVVLDPTDQDFSLTINGRDHWWIDDESIIIIANYIEKQLANS